MTKDLQIFSMGTRLFQAKINNCSECPCYNDGAGGEYQEDCQLCIVPIDMPSGYGTKGIAKKCPLNDIVQAQNRHEITQKSGSLDINLDINKAQQGQVKE